MNGKKVTRRTAMTTLAGLALAAGSGTRAVASATRPNIIFILSDDHRYDAFGFMDKPWLKTPHFDRLAREGVHFRNSFVTTSLCSPSRASFLTGQYAHCHGVTHNLTPWREGNITFLEILHARGYRAAFIGKWHMPGKSLPDLVGEGKLDRMVSFTAWGGQGLYQDCPLIVDGQPTKRSGYITDVLTQYALEFLDTSGPGPFCLFLSHKAVHYDFIPAAVHEGELAGAPLHPLEPNPRNLPLGAMHVPQRMNFEKNQQRYYETLLGVDDSVGELLRWLDDRSLAENTILIYQGDNGYFWGEHGLIDKRYAYEEGIRVPHLLRFPRLVTEGGQKRKEMVLNIDLAPTLLEAAGVEVPVMMQGWSYLPLLAPAQPLPWRRSWLYEYFSDPGFPHPSIRAVRTPEWKLITYPGQDKRFPPEMYHLATDPAERRDLGADPQYAERRRELETELTRLCKDTLCPSG
jgi:N-acetylglucosamine-6-sulfatase